MIDFVYRRGYDQLASYLLGKQEEAELSEDKIRVVLNRFKAEWRRIEDKAISLISEYSGPLPGRLKCYLSSSVPVPGITSPLTLRLREDIDDMVFSLIFLLNRVTLENNREVMNKVALTSIALDFNERIILNAIAFYNTLRVLNSVYDKEVDTRRLKGILGKTRMDLMTFDIVDDVYRRKGVSVGIDEFLEIVVERFLKERHRTTDSCK